MWCSANRYGIPVLVWRHAGYIERCSWNGMKNIKEKYYMNVYIADSFFLHVHLPSWCCFQVHWGEGDIFFPFSIHIFANLKEKGKTWGWGEGRILHTFLHSLTLKVVSGQGRKGITYFCPLPSVPNHLPSINSYHASCKYNRFLKN